MAARDERLEKRRAEAEAAYRILQFAHRHGITALEAEELVAKAGGDEDKAAQLLLEARSRKPRDRDPG